MRRCQNFKLAFTQRVTPKWLDMNKYIQHRNYTISITTILYITTRKDHMCVAAERANHSASPRPTTKCIPLIPYKSIMSFYFDATSIPTKIPLYMYKNKPRKADDGVWCSDIRIMRNREVYCMYGVYHHMELDSPVWLSSELVSSEVLSRLSRELSDLGRWLAESPRLLLDPLLEPPLREPDCEGGDLLFLRL